MAYAYDDISSIVDTTYYFSVCSIFYVVCTQYEANSRYRKRFTNSTKNYTLTFHMVRCILSLFYALRKRLDCRI